MGARWNLAAAEHDMGSRKRLVVQMLASVAPVETNPDVARPDAGPTTDSTNARVGAGRKR
jgi:hypothetical protein